MAVIAVDFDQTLFNESRSGEPLLIRGARDAMKKLKAQGHVLVIHTCRVTVAREEGRLSEEVQWIEDTLRAFDVPFDQIYLGDKLVADLYIDDRAVPFYGDWADTTELVKVRLRSRKTG